VEKSSVIGFAYQLVKKQKLIYLVLTVILSRFSHCSEGQLFWTLGTLAHVTLLIV